MRPLSTAGISISIFMALCGLFLILCGGVMGFLGTWVDGPFSSVWLRLYGVGLFLLGLIYVTPVLVFPRRPYVLAYLVSALCVTAFAAAAFALEPSVTGSAWTVVIYGGLLVVLPVTLSIVAWTRLN